MPYVYIYISNGYYLPGWAYFLPSNRIQQVIEFEGYKFSRLGRFVALLVPMNTLVLISLFVARSSDFAGNFDGWMDGVLGFFC